MLKVPTPFAMIADSDPRFARLLTPGAEVTGVCGDGSAFSSRIVSLSMGRTTTLYLEDLVIQWHTPGDDPIRPMPERVYSVCLGFDPRKMRRFFPGDNLGRPSFATEDGRTVDSVDSSVLQHLEAAGDDSPQGVRVDAYPYSSGYRPEVASEVSRSSLERFCVEISFNQPVDLGEARAAVIALETLIRAAHHPEEGFLEELWVSTKEGTSPSQLWLSRQVLQRDRTSVLDHRPFHRTSPLTIDELGRLEGIAQWLLLCRDVQQVLTVLRTHQFGLTADDKSAIASLAVGWENLAHHVDEDERILHVMQKLALDVFGEDPMVVNLIFLAWHTNNQIKHVELSGDARNALDHHDAASHRELADFMYVVLLLTSMQAAGMTTSAHTIASEINHMGWPAGLHRVNDEYDAWN